MAVVTNYATLQTEIADTLAQGDLTTYIPQFIQFAENKLYASLNLRNEETALSVSVSNGTGTVPTDFKALKFAYVNESPVVPLEWIPIEELYRRYPTRTGGNTPKFISREGANFTFGPSAKDFTLSGIYYAKQDPLRTTDPSWYVTNHPEVLLYGSLLEAKAFIKDDARIPVWKAFYDEAVDIIKLEERNSQHSKGKKQAWG